MDVVDGQMDVFEVLRLIEQEQVSSKGVGREAITAATVRERGQGETGTAGAVANPSGPPLWNRGSSPR